MMIKYLYARIKGTGKRTRSLLLTTLALTLILGLFIGVVYANVRISITDPDDYAPMYADFYGNEEWVAFFFYHDPSCVPDDFDLYFLFYDFANAENCDLTVEGFAIYENPGDFYPKQANVKGLGAVPIWFVSTSDFEAAIDQGHLTIADLENMESLQVGSASFYTEVLHPEGHPEMPMKTIKASGTMEDGRVFQVHSVWVGYWPTPVHSHVTISFK